MQELTEAEMELVGGALLPLLGAVLKVAVSAATSSTAKTAFAGGAAIGAAAATAFLDE